MCRKNLANLTAAERTAFVNAVNQLKQNGGYDIFPQIHSGGGSHGHGGPAFLSWHRKFIRQFEEALQAIDSNVWLPYWDFTVNNLNAAGTESLIWRDDFMGGPGNPAAGFAVDTGPFTGPAWNLTRNAFNIFQAPGNGGIVMNALNNIDYATFRSQIEGQPHGSAHVWVGGSVSSFRTSPRDPVFFLIHCNVDRLWAEWISNWEGTPNFIPYEPESGAVQGHNLNDTMWPWNGTTQPFGLAPWTSSPISVRSADVIDHLSMGYRYDSVDGCPPVIKPIKERLPKELKEALPKELKERLPKELKERGPKELKERAPKELKEAGPKELKERLPKELKERGPKELKERSPKEILEGGRKELIEGGGKEIRENIFIDETLRPDLSRAALEFDDDDRVRELSALLRDRVSALRRGGR